MEQNPYEAPEHSEECEVVKHLCGPGCTLIPDCTCAELEEDAHDREMDRRIDKERDK